MQIICLIPCNGLSFGITYFYNAKFKSHYLQMNSDKIVTLNY